MRRVFLMMSCACALLLSACEKTDAPAEATAPVTNTPSPVPTDTPNPSEGITMRYRCDSGHAVAIVRGEMARVTLADGRVVELARVADTSPPSYRGEALSFDIGGNGGTLGQDELGDFACSADD